MVISIALRTASRLSLSRFTTTLIQPRFTPTTPFRSSTTTIRLFSSKGEDGESSTEEAAAEEAADGAAEMSAEAAAPTEEDKVVKLEAEVKKFKENYMRAIAEQENIRAIGKRDVEAARSFAVTKMAKSLFDISDNLTRALDAVPEDMRKSDEHEVLKGFYEGVEMTNALFVKSYTANNIESFAEVGDAFDPALHDAMFVYEDGDKESNTIGQLLKCGYKLNGRVVRPAQVGTVKNA